MRLQDTPTAIQLTSLDDGEKCCAICNVALVRRGGEKPNQFKGRQTCSAECKKSLLTKCNKARSTKVEARCAHCGEQYMVAPSLRGRKHYCSQTCRRANKAREIKQCEECGEEFRAWVGTNRYCSQSCSATVNNRRRHESGEFSAQVEFICKHCNGVFLFAPSHIVNPTNGNRRVYCSRACRWAEEGKKPRTCAVCGALFTHRKSSVRSCSQECQQQSRLGPRVPRVILTCEHCSASFPARESAVINSTNGAKKRFCSLNCRAASNAASFGRSRPTSIETETYEALTALGIGFERQHPIGWYVTDAFIPETNTIVEAMGDYYHANPEVYPEPIYDMQKRTVARDRRRRTYFANHGYSLIELWEKDIREQGALTLLRAALDQADGCSIVTDQVPSAEKKSATR